MSMSPGPHAAMWLLLTIQHLGLGAGKLTLAACLCDTGGIHRFTVI